MPGSKNLVNIGNRPVVSRGPNVSPRRKFSLPEVLRSE
jgi:hypothetical protein